MACKDMDSCFTETSSVQVVGMTNTVISKKERLRNLTIREQNFPTLFLNALNQDAIHPKQYVFGMTICITINSLTG